MDPKSFIKNKSICTLPWSGFELEPNGSVKNCIIAKRKLGNINHTAIEDILQGEVNVKLKEAMLRDDKPASCSGCYLQEKGRSDLSSISSRLYYHKELGTKIDLDFYNDVKNFSLKHIDLRWTNACNQACVYCAPGYSSKWAKELGIKIKSDVLARQQVKDFVYKNISQLKNVYLAGGEPMLMKDNYEFLKLLKEKNKNCHVRVNTNLSKTDTGIFELLCEFDNVHWTVSLETIEAEYEYIRHHGSWTDFVANLEVIRKLPHKISFNMLHLVLNYMSLFDCVDYLKQKGFHDNSFIIGPLFVPKYYSVLNLPEHMIKQVKDTLKRRLDGESSGYLRNSYENLLSYYSTTKWEKDIESFLENTRIMDHRRKVDSRQVFGKVFEGINA